MNHNFLKNMALAALFLAIGLVLPLLHRPNPRCWQNAAAHAHPCAAVRPDLRLAVGPGRRLRAAGAALGTVQHARYVPPSATAMAFELAAYGAVIGYLYARSKWRCVKALYKCLIPAMIAGRIVWGRRDGRADGAGRQRLYLGAVPGRRPAQCPAGHRPAAGADPGGDGAAGSDEAGALYKAGSRLPAGGVSGRSGGLFLLPSSTYLKSKTGTA